MKSASFAGALVALAIVVPAQAEDRKTAPVYNVPPPVASPWTGFYIGVGGGARTARTGLTTALLTVQTISGLQNVTSTSQGGSGTAQGSTSRVSPYAGFNWQIAPQWVAGIEVDAGFGRQTATLSGFPFSPGFGSTGDAGTVSRSKRHGTAACVAASVFCSHP
jgi:outer membrane immunogenic protein